MKIALFTMAVGADCIYFDSVARYFPYNKKYFGQDYQVDYYLFTDREEEIKGIANIPCKTTVWPYTTMLKNNFISDYLTETNKWNDYDFIFFIDADFAIGDVYDFFNHKFILVKPYWNRKNGGGFFYGGKTDLFKKLCDIYYDELEYIYQNKLSLPRDLDEYYLGLFRQEFSSDIHIIEMERNKNTFTFFDNEDLDEKIKENGNKLFMQPYKADGRANKTMILDPAYKELECIINLKEQYIFNNYTYDFGRLVPLDEINYRILWAKEPEKREVLNIETNRISENITSGKTQYPSPVISVVMPVYNTPKDYLKDSIESTLKQTFTDFEFIIIDDGSTNTSCIDFIKTYTDPRIRLIENKHDFIDTLNRGIEESKGRYIARMDADDIMLPNRLKIQYEFMEGHPEVDVCGTWTEVFGDQKSSVRMTPVTHSEVVNALIVNNYIVHPSVIIRKDTVFKDKKHRYQRGYPHAEDYKLWIDLITDNYRFESIPKVLLRYRFSDHQITRNFPEEMLKSTYRIQVEYADYIMNEIIEKDENKCDILNNLIDLFNEGNLNIHVMMQIIRQLHFNYYLKEDVMLENVM